MRKGCALVACVACLVAARPAAAQNSGDVARAEALFNEALKQMEAGQYGEACPKLADSQKLVRGIGVTLYLAECYERSGKTASAWAQFRLAESLANARNDKRASIAHDRAETLEGTLPRVKIVVLAEANVPGLSISEDGSAIDRPEWGLEVPIDPGSHTFVARAPQKADWTKNVSVPTGKGTTTVEIPPLAEGTGTAPPLVKIDTGANTPPITGAATRDGSTQRIVGLVIAGAGLVGLAVGTVFGLMAKSSFSDSDPHCNAGDQCDPTGLGLQSDGITSATVSTIAFGVGAAALVGGGVLFFTAPKSGPSVGLSPSVGPRAAGLTLRGAF